MKNVNINNTKQENNINTNKRKNTTKTKRSQRNKKYYKKFNIYYNNCRGLKSKIESLRSIIKDLNPVIICLVETHLNDENNENIQLDNYELITMNRKKEGGGILMAIRKELYGSTIIVDMEEKDGEMIWIVIDNHRIKIRIGVIYAPQESRTMISELKKMYNKITKHVQAAKDNNQKILIVGDFNAKIGKRNKRKYR